MVECPMLTWNLEPETISPLKYLIFLRLIIIAKTLGRIPGVLTRPLSSRPASDWVTQMPARSPCKAWLAGFLKI